MMSLAGTQQYWEWTCANGADRIALPFDVELGGTCGIEGAWDLVSHDMS